MNKPKAVIVAVSLMMILLLMVPAISKDQTEEAASPEAAAESLHADEWIMTSPLANDQETDESNIEKKDFIPPLIAYAEPTDVGFRLTLEDSDGNYVQSLAYDAYEDFAVHLVAREAPSLDLENGALRQYDLVVVRPDQAEVEVFSLYSDETGEQFYEQKIKILDASSVMFVKCSLEEGSIIYELATLDMTDGSIDTLPAFWTVPVGSEEASKDFLLSAHYAQDEDGSITRVLLTSFWGKTWMADLEKWEIKSQLDQIYPAYGDLGSKGPRALIYPSPQLDRFVYSFLERAPIFVSNRFMVADLSTGQVLKQFSVDDGMLFSDPGPVWNREGSAFFLELADTNNADVMGGQYDNSHAVAAEVIALYDRDGNRMNTIEAGKGERINVYDWLDEHRLLIETYESLQKSSHSWSKSGIVYKEYDLRTDKLSAYRTAEHASELKEPIHLPLRREGTTFGSKAFVLLDRQNRQIWESNLYGRTFQTAGGELFIHAGSGDITRIYKWDHARRQLDMAASESHLQLAVGKWLIFQELESNRFIYRDTMPEISYSEDGIAKLPAEIAQEASNLEWLEWPDIDNTLDVKSIRATGKSRYGELRIVSEEGEKHVNYYYFGDYAVEFAHASGKKTVLPPLEKLELELSGEAADLQVFPFDGFDILIYIPRHFIFSQGFDSSPKKAIAYAATKQGDIFPLTFRYATDSSELQSDSITLFDQIPIKVRDNQLVFQGFAGERLYEFVWTPDLKQQSLALTAWRDRTEEAEGLKQIVDQYSPRLEQALGLTDTYFPEGLMDEERLRGLFTDKAWSNPGFQRLRKDFEQSAEEGNPSRAFAWEPIQASYDEYGNIRVTFTFNLFYAVGWAAHLEAVLKLDENEWVFYDFGDLQTEYSDGVAKNETDPMYAYNGLHIQDPLEF